MDSVPPDTDVLMACTLIAHSILALPDLAPPAVPMGASLPSPYAARRLVPLSHHQDTGPFCPYFPLTCYPGTHVLAEQSRHHRGVIILYVLARCE